MCSFPPLLKKSMKCLNAMKLKFSCQYFDIYIFNNSEYYFFNFRAQELFFMLAYLPNILTCLNCRTKSLSILLLLGVFCLGVCAQSWQDSYSLTLNIVLPILKTTKYTFLVEIQKVFLSLQNQKKRKKALLASNLSGLS